MAAMSYSSSEAWLIFAHRASSHDLDRSFSHSQHARLV
jgi:hypothetical protein